MAPAMAGVYRLRHPERTVLYRVLFHCFERFLGEYEYRFEKEYGSPPPQIAQHELLMAAEDILEYL